MQPQKYMMSCCLYYVLACCNDWCIWCMDIFCMKCYDASGTEAAWKWRCRNSSTKHQKQFYCITAAPLFCGSPPPTLEGMHVPRWTCSHHRALVMFHIRWAYLVHNVTSSTDMQNCKFIKILLPFIINTVATSSEIFTYWPESAHFLVY